MGWATKYGCCHEIWRVFLLFFPLNHFWDYIRGPWKIETIPSIFPPNCGFTNGDITKKSHQILENMKWTYLKLTPVKCQSLQHCTFNGVDNLFPVEACHFVQWYQNRRPKQNQILEHLETSWKPGLIHPKLMTFWIWNRMSPMFHIPSSPTLNSSCATWEAEVTLCCLARWAIGHTGDGRNPAPVDTCFIPWFIGFPQYVHWISIGSFKPETRIDIFGFIHFC